MARENTGAADAVEVAVAKPDQNEVGLKMAHAMACWENGPDGQPRQVWHVTGQNGVVREGYAHLGNVFLGAARASTNGPFVFLHGASYNVTRGWGEISTAVHSAGWSSDQSASYAPLTFASTNTTNSQWTATTQYTYNSATTITVSGAGLFMYTSAACATSAATAGIRLYNIGTFTAAQNVQANNTISVTLSLNIVSS